RAHLPPGAGVGGSHRRRRPPARGPAPRTGPAYRDRPGPRAVGAAGERAHADGRSRPVKATLSVAALLVTLAARGGRSDELPPVRGRGRGDTRRRGGAPVGAQDARAEAHMRKLSKELK